MRRVQDERVAQLLDAAAMAPRLHAALPGASATQLLGAQLHQSRRRLSRRTEEQGAAFLDLAYAIDVTAADGTPAATRWCHLQACTRGHAAELAERSNGIHLPELDAVLWPMEADPALTQLHDFLAPAQVQAAVARWSDGALVAGGVSTPPRVVRYEPRTHVVARIELPRAGRPRAVWGKAYAGDLWREVAQRHVLLWPHGLQEPRAFCIARPAGASAALRAVWQDEIVGAPLRDGMTAPSGPRLLEQTAQALGHLQSLPLLARCSLGPAELLARGRKQARKLGRAEAALAPALAHLVDRLERIPPPPAMPCNVHGDFHVDQIRVADGRLVLFDLDEFAVGHAAHDIADFASQLLTDTTWTPRLRSALARRFVEAALAASPRRIDPADIDWHLRALLLRKAYSFFVRHRAGWPQRVQHALALAALGQAALHDHGKELAA